MGNRNYSPEFKLQGVLEALQSDGTDEGAHARTKGGGDRPAQEFFGRKRRSQIAMTTTEKVRHTLKGVALSTDFTELSYADGSRKAYLMAVVDLESKYVPGWAVGPSTNRKLAMRRLEQVRDQMKSLGEELDEKIIHHELDSVYPSYRWLRATLLENRLHVSYSKNEAKGIRDGCRNESL